MTAAGVRALPELPAAANSPGGDLGKMISPQSLTVAHPGTGGL